MGLRAVDGEQGFGGDYARAIAGSLAGGGAGVCVARLLQQRGQFGNIVTFLYVVLLGTIGVLVLLESVLSIFRGASAPLPPAKPGAGLGARIAALVGPLPGTVDFPTSGLRISFRVPISLGAAVGMLTSLLFFYL